MKKIVSAVLAAAMTVSLLGGCSSSSNSAASQSAGGSETTVSAEGSTDGAKETVEVLFWSAPNQNQFNYWQTKAEEFNASGTESNGKIVHVTVEMLPETDSSEAAIQNAIATGTNPAVSENVSLILETVLSESDVLYDIQDDPVYKKIIADRSMEGTVEGWAIDGKQYVIPLYVNSVCLMWNVKALAALGFDEPPKTMDEYYRVIQTYVDKKDEMEAMGVIATIPGSRLLSEDGYQSGYDFQMEYSTFTQGADWMEEDALTIDRDGLIKTLEFWGALGNTNQLNSIDSPWIQDNIPVLFDIGKPWNMNSYDEAGKVYGVDYTFATVPVEKEGDQAYCYADTKGIAFYKTPNITEEVHEAAVTFVGWVYNEENLDRSDVEWIYATGMLPVRTDMADNSAFDKVFEERPALEFFADNIANAVLLPHFSVAEDVEVAFRRNGLIPYIMEAVTREPLDTLDASEYADAAIAAMKEAGGFN